MDLFTPIVEAKFFHPNFVKIMGKHEAANRAALEQWAEGFQDRDEKFVKEFQTTFNPCFWEIYLFACCKELGFKVDLAISSPDFVISNIYHEFCIEAVTANNAQGDNSEWETDVKTQPDVEKVFRTAVIRLSNAISSKHNKYIAHYQLMPHVRNKPFVLAVGPFEQPYFWAQNDHAIRTVLYAYDRIGPDGEYLFRHSINKDSDATIDLGLFTSPRMKEISAIIFSNTATFSKLYALNQDTNATIWFSALRFDTSGTKQSFVQNLEKKDYRESVLDGLYVFHNPHAQFPIPFDYFNHNDVAQGTLLSGDTVPRYKCKHGHLVQRTAMCLRNID